MNHLIAFYDIHCGMCCACKRWIQNEPAYIPISFVSYQSEKAHRIFPDIDSYNPAGEILVMADDGALYRGGKGWIMCLYALVEYREWAMRLAQPALLPMAKKVCHAVSNNRHALSKLFRDRGDADLGHEPEGLKANLCTDGNCKIADRKSKG